MTSDVRAINDSGQTPPDDRPESWEPDGTPGPQATESSADVSQQPTSEPAGGSRARGRRRSPRRIWLLVPAITLAFGILGALYAVLPATTYSASALVQVDAAVLTPNDSPDQIDDQEMATQRLVMTSDAVAAEVVQALKLSDSVTSIQRSIVAQQVMDSRVLRVTATRDSPDGAAALANAFAQQYLVYRSAQRDEALSEASKDSESGLRAGPVGVVLTPAIATDTPSGPSPAVVLIVSVLLGLAVSITACVYLERRRQAQRDA